ncbi:MAG: efflux RND transporter periplasmic adaptor subunit [Chloroflexi bacterium]|nr:efflux RND transporter periplasmic adaptor subunit [Chloroflexota bacterium]
MKSQRIFVIIGSMAIVLLVVLALVLPRVLTDQSTTSTIETTTVRRGTLTASVSATGALGPAREAQLAFSTTGSLVKLDVKAGDSVRAGQIVAALDTRELELQLAQAEAGLAAAQARLDQLQSPASADVTAAQASVASAEAALAQLKDPNPNDVLIAKTDVEKAAAAVARAQAEYDRIGGASNPFIAMTPQSLALQSATLDYQKAQAVFNARFNPTETQLKQAQAAVEQARAQLARLTNPSPNDIRSAQANADQARAARDLAKTRLDYAIIKAPFDGVVTRVDVDWGSTVTAGRAVVWIADISEYRVKLNIDETDIAKIRVGQEATINLSAYPGVTIPARVSDVASNATLVQGVVNYVVSVSLNPQQPVPLKLGMTADANLLIANRENVLIVSNRAIRAAGNNRYVTLRKDDQTTQEIPVKTGMANDLETEIVSGLTEGQVVIISLLQANPLNSGFGAPRR